MWSNIYIYIYIRSHVKFPPVITNHTAINIPKLYTRDSAILQFWGGCLSDPLGVVAWCSQAGGPAVPITGIFQWGGQDRCFLKTVWLPQRCCRLRLWEGFFWKNQQEKSHGYEQRRWISVACLNHISFLLDFHLFDGALSAIEYTGYWFLWGSCL